MIGFSTHLANLLFLNQYLGTEKSYATYLGERIYTMLLKFIPGYVEFH